MAIERRGIRRSPHAWRPVRSRHAGLASGFISSTATIGAMGARVAKTPDVLAAAVAGAVLSTIATIVQCTCSCRHQHGNPSNAFGSTDLRGLG
ncbi:MAG: DUF4010 domain-containing protein, partial [Croceibacterium sp.]